MTAEALVAQLEALGVRLWEDGGKLRFRAPTGVLTPQRMDSLREHRDAILGLVRAARGPLAVAHPRQRYEPFPLTDVQAAYLLGRRDSFAFGGVACHGYGELTFTELDVDRLQGVWNALIARHDMLRAVVDASGFQRVLRDVPEYHIAVEDVADEDDAAVASTRAELDHRVYQPDQWPLFTLRVTRAKRRCTLHFSIDFLICDFVSIQVLLDELYAGYYRPAETPEPLEITFRDYLLAERPLHAGPRYERDRAYWLDRVDELPPAPELPLVTGAESSAPPRFRRHAATLSTSEWAGLRERAGRHGITPSGAVLAAYAEVIAAWSRTPRFTLDITLLNRSPVHPQVNRLVGDFTSVNLLAVSHRPDVSFHQRAKDLQAALWADLDHRLFSGVEVVREIARRRGGDAALMPVVFTSAIGLGAAERSRSRTLPEASTDVGGPDGGAAGFTDLGYGISQTPQVWIDCQNIERAGGLSTNWDVREGVFPDGLVEDAFAAYEALLRRLAVGDEAWEDAAPVPLPTAQRERRVRVNATQAPVPHGLLHDGVLAQARRTPDAPALVSPDTTLSYAQLLGRAAAIAAELDRRGSAPGELVAVVADKGWQQIAGVLGTLIAGGVYVPVDTNQPPARRDQILTAAGIRIVLTQETLARAGWPAGCEVVTVDGLNGPAPAELPPARVGPDDLAYVIHTSGSTGQPKGVMISHRAALNTVHDINQRFGVQAGDRVLGLANLGFDLSVYDIFGPPAVGACLVLPDPARRADPTHWADLIATYGVTVWNSVPAQMQMLSDYLQAVPWLELPSLRLAMLSGDWIPVPLPDQIRRRLPGLRVVSLGGATEAAIWSIWYPIEEVDPSWRSIPYGVPLANQTFHVLDGALRPRPDWAVGELHIGGVGLAAGYLNDAARTAERFITAPRTGERLYRTGDLGRYLPDGTIEFLGRDDFQVGSSRVDLQACKLEYSIVSPK